MSSQIVTGTATTDVTTYTYTETQNRLKVVNESANDININVPGNQAGEGFFNVTIHAYQSWENEVDYTTFTIFTTVGTADFTATVTNDYPDNVDIDTQLEQITQEWSINTNHIFADNTARDAYFVANPTELVDRLFISVGTGYQQYLNEIWVSKTPVLSTLNEFLTVADATWEV